MSGEAPKYGEWQPIETAPRDGFILLYGSMIPDSGSDELRIESPLAFAGYWDDLDDAWCSIASSWRGPFYEPTHWTPLPEPPA